MDLWVFIFCYFDQYWTGLQGIFIFDDVPNLKNLIDIGEGAGLSEMIRFALEGKAGPLGRPISLFSFALQVDAWPYHPWDFKYVNLMIHLINGCLVFWFILLITRLMDLPEKRGLLLALLTASIWLWHPLHVSTVLYVIQRMTQLSTLFTLAGLIVYLQGRQHLIQNKLKSGFFLVSIGVALGGILATFSKENGVLLVLYIIVLEITVLRTLAKPRYWSIWFGIFLYLPLILLASYFLIHIDSLLGSYAGRDFTLGERLLTQTRILVNYLAKILLLHPYDFGLYHDDYLISHHLLKPPTTLISVCFIIIMFIIALWKRRTLPVLALGILWFLAGHLLESSFIGLVLYFEHRNYLALLGIIFLTFYSILWLFDHIFSSFLRKVTFFFSPLFLALFLLITGSQTDLWGKPLTQTVFWAQEHPHSLAAQSHAVAFFQRINEYDEAEKYIKNMVTTFPKNSSPYLYWIALSCLHESVNLPDMSHMIRHFKNTQYDHATPDLITFILEKRAKGYCQVDSNSMDKIINTLIHNPNNALYQAYFYYRYALFYSFEKRYKEALQVAEQALKLKYSIPLRLKIIKWLIADNQFEKARASIQALRTEINPIKVHLYDKELKLLALEINVRQEMYDISIKI